MVTDPPNKVKPGTVVADPFSTSTQAVKPDTIVADPFSAETQPPPKAPAAPVSQAPELDPFGDVIAKPSLAAKQEPMVPTTKMTEGMPFVSQRQNMMELERKEELSAEIARQNMFLNSPFAGMNEEQLNKAKQGIEAEKMAFDKIGQSIVQRTGSLKESAAALEATRKQLEQQIQENPALQPELSAQYDAAVEAHNKEARTVQALIPIAEDYASKLGLDEMAATMQDYEIKKGQGSWGGAIANKFTGSIGEMFAGVLDFNQVIDKAMLNAIGNEKLIEAYDKGTKGASDYARSATEDLLRIESTTKEYVQEKEKGLLGGAVLGLAGSAAPMMTPGMSGMFFQSYDGAKQEMSGPEWADVSENEKAALAATTGIIAASLERFGFSNMAKNTPVVRQILGSSLPKMIPGMSAGQINRLVNAETDSWIRNAIVRTGSGFLAEAETGATQELADIGMKEMYNEAKGRDLFQTPESFVDAFGQVVRSGIPEGIGGGIMSAPFAYSAARNAGAVGKQQTEKQYEFMEKLFTDPDYVDTFKAASEAKVKAGEVTQAEVDRAVDDLQVASKLMQKMPEDMPADKRRQAFDLLLEKERLSKKEKAMVEGKVQEIDDKLRKLASIETKTPTTDKTSTNTATIKQGDGSVSKDGGHRFIVDGRISLPVKGDGSQDAIRETTAWADEVTSLNDGTIILTDPDNGPVQKLVVGRGDETSFWLEDAKTGEVMWKSGDNIGLLKSRVGNGDILSTPTAATAKIDPEGDLTDDQLNALAEDPSLAATKAATSGGVDVNDSAAINELATRLQGLNKAGADYAAIIGKAAKAATTLRSITPGVNIQVHETADTIPVGDASSGNRGVLTITGRDANGNAEGTIHINLDQATENTIAHEIGHVALRQAFGADPKLFTQFKERIKKAVKPSDFKAVEAMMGKDYSSAEAPEEFLADLTQMVSDRIDSGDPLTAKEITAIDKVVAIINDFLKALGIDPILVDPRDARATLEFFRDLGTAANAGVAVNTELAEGVGGVGTVRSSGKSEIEAGADAIAAMNDEVRDNTEFKEMPGGYPSYNLYQARNLMKRPSDKLKRVTDSNSADLWTSWHSIANVDGTLYGVTKYEDPDAASDEEDSAGFPKEFVWAYAPLSSPDSITETQTSDVAELMTQIRTARPVYSKADSNVVRLLKGSEFLNAAPAQRKQMLIDARAQDAAERAAQEAKVVAQAKAAGAKQERVRSKEDLSKMKEQYKAFIDSYDAATKKSMAELEEEFIARNAKDVDLARAAIDNLKAQLQESKEDLKRVAKDGFNLGRGIGSVEGEVRGIGEGLKQAAAAQKKIREDVAAYLSLIKQKGDISVAQSKALINAAMRIKIGDPASFTKFENYVDKVMDDAAYAARIEQVRDLQAKATKRKHSLMSGIVKEFTSIDPENIPSSLMADYVSALKNLAKKVPSYSDMKGLVIQISNARPIPTAGKFDSATSFSELNQAITSIASNQLNSVEDFMSMLRDMRSVAKRASELNSLDPSDPNYLSDTQYNGLVDGLALTSRKLSDEYIKEVEPLKKALIGNIRSITVPYSSTSSADADPSENLLQDAATLSDKQLMSLDPIQLQDLSELMAQAVADRYVDVSRLFPIVTAAKVYSDAENMANNLRKVKMDQVKLGELLARTDVSFWSSVSGMGARVANVFDRGIVAPWIKADAGRIRLMRDTGSKVVDLKEKYKLGPKLTDSIKANAMRKQVPNYVMDKIGAVVRYLEEYELGTRVDRSDEFGQYGTRDMFEPSTLEKLDKGGAMHTAGADQTKKHWEKAWLSFPKTNGKVDPKDVYESVTKNDGRYLSKEEGAFFNELMEWKAKNITPKQRYANAIRGIPFNELQFHMPRVKIGPASTSDAEALATPVTNKNLGLRSGTGYSRSENQPLGLFETNIESLIHNNAESTGRDFYFNSALKEVSLALKEAGKNVAGEGNLEQVVAVIRDSVQQSINAGLTPLPSNGAVEKLFAAAMSAASMRALLRPLRVIPDLLSSSIDMAGRTGSLSIYPKAVTQLNGLKDDVKRLMDDTNSNHADRLSISRHIEIGRDEIVEQGKLAKAREYMSSLAEKIMAAPVWMTMFESSFMDAAGQKFDMEKYKSSAIYRATNKEAVNIAAAQADFVWSRYTGTGTIVGQKRKNNALFADVDSKTKTGRSLAWMTGYSERQRQALIDSFRYARETMSSGSGAGKLKGSGTFLATATGTLISGLAYAMGMQMAHLAWMAAAGDDEEKKKAAENMEKMKSPEYAGGEALASMASLAGTKYGSVGRYSIRVLGSLYYAWLDSQETPTDPEAKREFNSRKAWAKEMVRNFTYSAPIETSGKGGSGKAVVHSMADAIPVVGSLSALIEQELEAVKSSKKLGKEAESIEEVAILTGQMSLALFNTVAFLYGIQFSSAALDKKAAGIMKDQELGKTPTTAAGFKARTMSRFNRMAEDDAQMESDRAFEDKGLIDKLLQDDPNDEE